MKENIEMTCDVNRGELVCKVRDNGREIGKIRYDLDLSGRRTNVRIEGEELQRALGKNPSIFEENDS